MVPRNSCLCSLCCFSLSYKIDLSTSVWEEIMSTSYGRRSLRFVNERMGGDHTEGMAWFTSSQESELWWLRFLGGCEERAPLCPGRVLDNTDHRPHFYDAADCAGKQTDQECLGTGTGRKKQRVFQKVSKRVIAMVSLHTQCLDGCGDRIWKVAVG